MNKYREVLNCPKFHLTESIIRNIYDEINRCGLHFDGEKIDIALPHPKDEVFYEVMMEVRKAEDAYLVTGNIKRFPVKPYVVTPRRMMDIIIEDVSE